VERSSIIQVIATTDDGTRTALAEAKRLSTSATHASIVLLVPQLLSSTSAVDGPRETTRVTRQYRHLAEAAGVEVLVRLCVCRRYRDIFRWMLGGPSLVVVGGRRRWWWPTTAQRMASGLRRAGHAVVFTEVG
jgi:hypothetical protein